MADISNTPSSNAPQARGLVQFVIDRLFSWILGFPSERCSYTTTPLRIPIGDGTSRVYLAADLLQPAGGVKTLGTVLIRSPYGRAFPIAIVARVFAARSYQVLIVSCRGTFGSGGEFDPFRTEVEDGQGVVTWMRDQPWYTGTFATVGGSYLGFVQWAILCDPPHDLVVASPAVSPHDFSRPPWRTGAMDLDIVRWAGSIAIQEKYSILRRLVRPVTEVSSVFDSVPLGKHVRTFLGEGSPFLDEMLQRPDMNDPYYEPMKLHLALEKANIPIFISTGWYDLFNEQSMEQYARLKERGVDVTLTVGPWKHFDSGFSSKMNRQAFDFIEEHLAGNPEAKRSSPVEYFVTGSKEWKTLASYPPPTTPHTLYLQEGGNLGSSAPSTASGSSSFTFDPHNPTPTVGGNGLQLGGSTDDTALSKRSDVLTFDSAPLDSDLEFCGRATIHLAHSTDIPFADVFVRVSEVSEKGKSHNICEAFQRLDPKRGDQTEIKSLLSHCSHRFMKGKRIRVIIAGGCFPQFTRNQGVDNEDGNAVEMKAVRHTVHHDETRTSKLVLPVVTT